MVSIKHRNRTRRLILPLIIIASFLFLLGCVNVGGESVQSPPFTESQFYSRVTDLNYLEVRNGDFNFFLVGWDGNKLTNVSRSDLNGGGGGGSQDLQSVTDVNAYTTNLTWFLSGIRANYFAGVTTNAYVDLSSQSFYTSSLSESLNWGLREGYDDDFGAVTLNWGTRDLFGNWEIDGNDICHIGGNCPSGGGGSQDLNTTMSFGNWTNFDLNMNGNNIKDVNVLWFDGNKNYGIMTCQDGNVIVGFLVGYSC